MTNIFRQSIDLYRNFYQSSKRQVLALHALELVRSLTGGAGILLIIPLLIVAGIDTSIESNDPLSSFFKDLVGSSGIAINSVGVLSVYLALVTIITILNYLTSVLAVRLQQDYITRLRIQIYADLLLAKWDYIHRQRMSEFVRLMTEQVYMTSAALGEVLSIIQQIVTGMIYLMLAMLLSPMLSLIALGSGLILLAIGIPLNRLIRASGETRLLSYKDVYQILAERLPGIRLIKSHAVEERYINELKVHSDRLEQQEVTLSKINTLTQSIQFLTVAMVLSILLYVALEFMTLEISTLMVLLFIFLRFLPLLSGIQTSVQSLQHEAAGFDDLQRFRAELADHLEPESEATTQLTRQIELRNLFFAYPGKSEPVFKNLNAAVPINTTTVISGQSGAGKSTLADILAGLLQPNTGSMLIDGKELEQSAMPGWRRHIAYVSQDIYLFHDSVRNNLTAASQQADAITDDDLWRALDQAAVAEVVKSLPEQLDTIIGDQGTQLSGGQRQRLAIARAFLGDAGLLLFDEATSELDRHNVERIARSLDQLHGKKTVIIIAHDESLPITKDQQIEL